MVAAARAAPGAGRIRRLTQAGLARAVRVPTMVLHARDDRAAPFSEGRRLASLIPGAEFVPLDSANHVLLEHEPAWTTFLSHLDRFTADA